MSVSCSTARSNEVRRVEHRRSRLFNPANTANCWCPKAIAANHVGRLGSKPVTVAAKRLRLRRLAGPRTRATIPWQPASLQLALVLGLRQRRHRQPGRARDGRRPLGDRRTRPCPPRSGAWAVASCPREKRTRDRRRTWSCLSMNLAMCCWSSKRAAWSTRRGLHQCKVDKRVLHDRRRDPRRQLLSQERR